MVSELMKHHVLTTDRKQRRPLRLTEVGDKPS